MSLLQDSAVGVVDRSDLDADGAQEVFLDVGGNTAGWGILLDWNPDECALRAVTDPTADVADRTTDARPRAD